MRTRNMRPGQIMLWYGTLATIPNGWHLCNGEMNTPDLRNIFVVAAGDALDPDDSGGLNTHSHPYTGPFHIHTIDPGGAIAAGTFLGRDTDQSRMSGTSNPANHRPPYHALAYMMKIN